MVRYQNKRGSVWVHGDGSESQRGEGVKKKRKSFLKR